MTSTLHHVTKRLVLLAAATMLVAPSARAAADVDRSSGPVVVVDAETRRPLESGGSGTAFSVELPDGAACPGDSLNDYRVQSFLVPEGVDPGTLLYQGVRPGAKDGSARYWALYEVNSNTYVNRSTDVADEEGGEGTIINVPAFDYAVFDPGMVPTGRSHLGIACSLYGETTRYWSTDIDITEDINDPAGIAWTVVNPVQTGAAGGANPGVVVAAVALVLAAGAVLVRRRSGPTGRVKT